MENNTDIYNPTDALIDIKQAIMRREEELFFKKYLENKVEEQKKEFKEKLGRILGYDIR